MRVLVEAEVVVTPRRHPGVPFERVRAEVEIHQLTVFFDAPGRPVVHERHERRDGSRHLVRGTTPQVAGVEAVTTGAIAEHGDGLDHLPPRHGAKAGVGGQEVHQVRGARSEAGRRR